MTRPPLPFQPDEVGVDEAGRGPLAGPLVVAAAILPAGFDAAGLTDSKLLTAHQRDVWFEKVQAEAIYAVEVISEAEIDRKNILAACLAGMVSAVTRIAPHARTVVVDGNIIPPGMPIPATCLVKGDSKHAAIAAASVLAKVTRDRIMARFAEEFPEYGFEVHHGYASPDHLEAIRRFGPCPIHRRSFEPIKTMVNQPCLIDVP